MTARRDILLAICPAWSVEIPPLGMGYLVECLKESGFSVEVMDLNLEVYHRVHESLRDLWAMHNSRHWVEDESYRKIRSLLEGHIGYCVERILSVDSRVVAFSTYSPTRYFTIDVIEGIRRVDPERNVIVGGRGIEHILERKLFRDGLVDVFVKGEGEDTLIDIMQRYKHGWRMETVPGALVWTGEGYSGYVPREPIKDLDRLPWPRYSEFSLGSYATKSLPILMSRGCVGRCAFCDDQVVMRRFRARSPENVLEEIKFHVRENHVSDFWFNDVVINGDIKRLERFCDLVVGADIRITWMALAIPWKGLRWELLEKMRRAGCVTLNFGVESGSDRVLARMRKIFTAAEAAKVLAETHAAGINTQINIIVGFPGETDEDFEDTLEFLRKNRDNIDGVTSVNTCLVLLESDLSRNPERYGIEFPEDLRVRDCQWWIGTENTPAVREERLGRVFQLLEELGLSFVVSSAREKVMELDALVGHDRS